MYFVYPILEFFIVKIENLWTGALWGESLYRRRFYKLDLEPLVIYGGIV